MLKDIKTGLILWQDITNLKYMAIRVVLLVAAGVMTVIFVPPRVFARIKQVSLSIDIDVEKLAVGIVLLYLIVFCVAIKQIAHATYCGNKDLFYQLAVSKRAGYICAMLQQLMWYGYGLVMLLAICDKAILPIWFLIPAYTLLFIMGFGFFYNRADMDNQKRTQIARDNRIWMSKNKERELIKITVYRLYRCRNLTVGKIILIIFTVSCGWARILHGNAFLLASAFLILLNDAYWKNESRNFQYFSNIGVPVSRYLQVHLTAGICFNIVTPLLIFYGMTGDMVMAAVGFGILSYLVIFWYLTQFYLYLFLGDDKETLIILCDIGCIVMAVLPPVALLVTVWLYKKIAHKWREEACSQ